MRESMVLKREVVFEKMRNEGIYRSGGKTVDLRWVLELNYFN